MENSSGQRRMEATLQSRDIPVVVIRDRLERLKNKMVDESGPLFMRMFEKQESSEMEVFLVVPMNFLSPIVMLSAVVHIYLQSKEAVGL